MIEMADENKQLTKKLEENFAEIYAKFKIHFYQEMFSQLHGRETSLTTVETLCVETIHALNNPTVKEFSSFINISPPNAAYKINSLISKGYIKKVRSADDRREYQLMVTDKYYQYYNISASYQNQVMQRIREHFKPEQLDIINTVLQVINDELMPEIPNRLVAGVAAGALAGSVDNL